MPTFDEIIEWVTEAGYEGRLTDQVKFAIQAMLDDEVNHYDKGYGQAEEFLLEAEGVASQANKEYRAIWKWLARLEG